MESKTGRDEGGLRIWGVEILKRSMVSGLSFDLVLDIYLEMGEGLLESGLRQLGSGSGEGYLVGEYDVGELLLDYELLKMKLVLILVRSHLFGGAICYEIKIGGDCGLYGIERGRVLLPLSESSLWEDIRETWDKMRKGYYNNGR